MATIAFSGALQPKKKAELQEIATALQISDHGTKEDLQNRIKGHLDKHQAKLEEEPAFAGLFGRVKRKRAGSEKPLLSAGRFVQDDSSTSDRSPTRSSRRVTALNPIRESTPVENGGPVSSLLSRFGLRSPAAANNGALVSSPSKSIRDMIPTPDEMLSVVKRREEMVLQQGSDMLLTLRGFLSNSRNIWSLTALFELLFILYAIIPWAFVDVPLSPTVPSKDYSVPLPYPPLAAFQQKAFWTTIGHWSLPALFIPALFGTLISFRPTPQHSPSSQHPPSLPFDALTASIIRLAAQIAYPFATVEKSIQGLDVIGWRWRVLAAGVGVAFAFAEAISANLVPATVVIEDDDEDLTQLQIEG